MKIFLLSPAFCGGRRATMLLRPGATTPLARRLHAGELTLGEAFAFMSGLYFRGKLAYATAFAEPGREGTDGVVMVITPTRGLRSPRTSVSAELLREFASVNVDGGNPRYTAPLVEDLNRLAATLPDTARVVLLGSIATAKYVELLREQLGSRLCYPPLFVGRGDMSRGGLLLRCVESATELDYAVAAPDMQRRGPRPPKLEPIGARPPL